VETFVSRWGGLDLWSRNPKTEKKGWLFAKFTHSLGKGKQRVGKELRFFASFLFLLALEYRKLYVCVDLLLHIYISIYIRGRESVERGSIQKISADSCLRGE